jgi:hypothetical protein
MKRIFLPGMLLVCLFQMAFAQGDGFLQKDGRRVFPLGSYYMPKDDAALKEMVDAGFNLFYCGSKADLDRVQKYGAQGWFTLQTAQGVTPEFKKLVNSVAGHPALALWDGGDEIVWNFTAQSKLYRTLHIFHTPGAWRNQTPEAVAYARKQSAVIMPKIHDCISYIRSVDPNNLQVWINEGETSDMGYTQQYMDAVDITGCDLYPIKTSPLDSAKPRSQMKTIGKSAKKWTVISQGKPIWMVLQAFSWSDLMKVEPEHAIGRPVAYPSFFETRYMAYDVIANGARGVLYWDMRFLSSEPFRQSLFAMSRELAALQPFLTTDPKPISITSYVPAQDNTNQVVGTARQYGRDWMVALVNEGDTTQLATVVEGLNFLDGSKLQELYGDDEVTVKDGRFVTRLRPFEVKVFATSRKWEVTERKSRDYAGQ